MSKLNITSEADDLLVTKLIELSYALSGYDQMNGGPPQDKSQHSLSWSNFAERSNYYNPWQNSPLFEKNCESNSFWNISDTNNDSTSQSSLSLDSLMPLNSTMSTSEETSPSFDIDSFMRALTSMQHQDITNNNFDHVNEDSFFASLRPTDPISNRLSSPEKRPVETQTYIEQVQVESSAHVSFIVGKQGSKIRQIRTETETHIQTPVNGEEPVFVLKGRKRNVQAAKERILIEAHNYSMALYNQARNYKDGERRQVNIYLPARFIGLVVGKKGSSIKRIMEMSGADIVTPKVNTINGFKLFGTGPQIRAAVDHIKLHIMTNNNVTIVEETNLFEITLHITSK